MFTVHFPNSIAYCVKIGLIQYEVFVGGSLTKNNGDTHATITRVKTTSGSVAVTWTMSYHSVRNEFVRLLDHNSEKVFGCIGSG